MARMETNEYLAIDFKEIQDADIFIVDMIKGFVEEGAMADSNIRDIVPEITKLIDSYQQIHKDREIYCFVDSHQESAIEFNSFPKHCVAGTSETKIVEPILSMLHKPRMILKNSTNGFHELDFYLPRLKNNEVDTIVITGCCTDICVMQFALSLKTWLNSQNLNIKVIVLVDCVDTYDSGTSYHPAPRYNEMALSLMQQAGIQIHSCITYNN